MRRGNAQFRMGEVADEAGVSRSTVYRYFPGRDEVLLALMLTRVDTALGESGRSLRRSRRPGPLAARDGAGAGRIGDGNPLNEALFAAESTAVPTALERVRNPSWSCC